MTKNFEIVYRNPAELIPYEMNAKKHDEQQIRDLAAAIKKRGFDQPITVDKHDVIITGHGRREAALLAGLERVPVIVRDDLSEEEVKAKRLVSRSRQRIIAANWTTGWWASWLWLTRNCCWRLAIACFLS